MTQRDQAGFRITVSGREYRLLYRDFPWFQNATAASVRNVILDSSGDLHWPDLDVDLEISSLNDLDRFPLIARGS
jgi:hypothetical protein